MCAPSNVVRLDRTLQFGAKLSISLIDGVSFVDRISWDNYNEGLDLIGQIEFYRMRFGFYPESVHAEKIYRNRKNRRYCKKHHIRCDRRLQTQPKSSFKNPPVLC
jgi:hypothetical protein